MNRVSGRVNERHFWPERNSRDNIQYDRFVFDWSSTSLWNLVIKLRNLGEIADFIDYKYIRNDSKFGLVYK